MRYRVVNRRRFITFLVIVILIFSFTILSLVNITRAHDKIKPSYTEITVKQGDTLWALAKEYGSQNKDVREIVYDICQLNNIKADELRAGQTILIP